MLLSVLLCTGSPARAQELKLPNLGESSTSMFSAEFEHQLGRTWLRIFRSPFFKLSSLQLCMFLIFPGVSGVRVYSTNTSVSSGCQDTHISLPIMIDGSAVRASFWKSTVKQRPLASSI